MTVTQNRLSAAKAGAGWVCLVVQFRDPSEPNCLIQASFRSLVWQIGIFAAGCLSCLQGLIEGGVEARYESGDVDNKRHDDQLQTVVISGASDTFIRYWPLF
jgi:hypothetical protein